MKILVMGAAGFIGSHLVQHLRKKFDSAHICGVDLKKPRYFAPNWDRFYEGDLRSQSFVKSIDVGKFDRIYQLAADMGGAGYVFTGDNDAEILSNSALINLNLLSELPKHYQGKIFYSSSACIYPEYNQLDPNNPICSERSAYPAAPDSEYGWEKLFSERLYLSHRKNFNFDVCIARFHNIFGPYGSWNDGREKAPAALCRKVAMLKPGESEIEIWGDGSQTRSFLFIDQCLHGIEALMDSHKPGPYNIGSEEMISIRQLVELIGQVANKKVTVISSEGPVGVNGRNSDNSLIYSDVGWKPDPNLEAELSLTYKWIEEMVRCGARDNDQLV